MTTIESKAARAAQKAIYAPRTRPAQRVHGQESALDVKLRKLTGQVLDELKFPSAIPSQVIEQALRAARHL